MTGMSIKRQVLPKWLAWEELANAEFDNFDLALLRIVERAVNPPEMAAMHMVLFGRKGVPRESSVVGKSVASALLFTSAMNMWHNDSNDEAMQDIANVKPDFPESLLDVPSLSISAPR